MEHNEHGISRRSFLTGATAAGALTMLGGVVGCAPSNTAANAESGSTADGGSQPSFMTAPEPIADGDVVETVETEVLVIGAGYSGLVSAISSAENGLRVLIAEKTGQPNGRGAGTGVINSSYAMSQDAAVTDKASAAFRWMQTCGNRADESLVGLFFEESGKAMDWLLEKAEPYNVKVDLWDGYSRNPLLPDEPGYHMLSADPGASGVADFDQNAFFTVELLNHLAQDAGIDFLFNAPAVQLVKEGDAVVGAILDTEEGYKKILASRAVVLATGDIAADEEMVDYYCPIAKKAQAIYTPVGINTGDGHKMALWAGAAMQDGPFPPMLHPQRYCDKSSNQLQGPFMFVNQEGERFFNEGTWVQPKSLQIMQNTKDGVAYTVFDSNWREDLLDSLPHGGGMFWDSFRYKGSSTYEDTITYYEASLEECIEMGTAFVANSIEELAEQIGAPVDVMVESVARYNGICETGEDTDFNKDAQFLYPIQQPPYYSTKVGACLLTIVGGVQVNRDLQCLDGEGNPIEGLYAVGNASGSVYAVDYPINVPGNSHGRCLTWGYHVGRVLGGVV